MDFMEYRITPQPGSIASPLELITQCRPMETHLPQLPSALGALQMHSVCQELIRRQGNKPEREYQELVPGMPLWVQHRQNAKWEPATVVRKVDSPISYWIMCTDGAGQPKVFKRMRTSLKIRSTPTDIEAKSQLEEWRPETVNKQHLSTSVLDENRCHPAGYSTIRFSNDVSPDMSHKKIFQIFQIFHRKGKIARM